MNEGKQDVIENLNVLLLILVLALYGLFVEISNFRWQFSAGWLPVQTNQDHFNNTQASFCILLVSSHDYYSLHVENGAATNPDIYMVSDKLHKQTAHY